MEGEILLCTGRLVQTCPLMEVASNLLTGLGEGSRTFWDVASFGWPGWGLGHPESPREGSTVSKRSTEEERGEESQPVPILRFVCVQVREWLPLLPPPAHGPCTVGQASSVAPDRGCLINPIPTYNLILIENFISVPNN